MKVFTYRGPLLPKLRGYFAEFITTIHSIASILYLTTCVGLGIWAVYQLTRGFSRQHRIMEIRRNGTHHLSGCIRTDLPISPTGLHQYNH